ncbi:hypothetical protein EVAR_97963_1 [Eumeta japonica]|uniref:Histone-lysine N-methyltransferase SETMAR n=1 Tax=Eumeta variegata TaxID=151549 RepID=A0A4C1XHC5_EUMVA|nr:hypothetical protein EVAR_97963_1 [Eumeta japonica]
MCDSLLKRNETEPFLKRLITGDEEWIMYDKNVRKDNGQENYRIVLHFGITVLVFARSRRAGGARGAGGGTGVVGAGRSP